MLQFQVNSGFAHHSGSEEAGTSCLLFSGLLHGPQSDPLRCSTFGVPGLHTLFKACLGFRKATSPSI